MSRILRADVDAIILAATGLAVAAGIVLGVWPRLRSVTL